MGWDTHFFFFFFFLFFFSIYARHEKKRKHVVCRGLSFFSIINILPPTVYIALSISSSLHTLSNDRLTGVSLKEVVGGGCFNFSMQQNKNENEIKTKTKMCGDAYETGSVDLGGWMNATYLYIYIYGLLLITLVLHIQSTKSYREVKRLV